MNRLYWICMLAVSSCIFKQATHESCNSFICPAQYELEDSNKLDHVKGLFYRNAAGHLYERTMGLKHADERLVDHEYFNGFLNQDVDPFTFESLDGWYAKDKNAVYYYRPISGGMHLAIIDGADVHTFEILRGHYRYAKDAHHFYDGSMIIEGFSTINTEIEPDERGKAVRIISKGNVFVFDKD